MATLAGPANSAEPLKELRIGYQKIGALLIVKEQKVLEQRLELQGVRVRWIEFAFAPPLLEALGAGAIDYGYTGDSPPIFAQAATRTCSTPVRFRRAAMVMRSLCQPLRRSRASPT